MEPLEPSPIQTGSKQILGSAFIDDYLIAGFRQASKQDFNIQFTTESPTINKDISKTNTFEIREYKHGNNLNSFQCFELKIDGTPCSRSIKNTVAAKLKHAQKYHSKVFKCKCSTHFGNQRDFLIHNCSYKPRYSCPKCLKQFEKMKELIKHCNTEPKDYEMSWKQYAEYLKQNSV